ncbi:hypothetical protein AWZ03_014685 [Drosophila navojoa]|uniref:Uncharacterized protein n=1 Tax=Drosophila navojoa TaxID=7232 RepID=A0A484ATP3_DRONA|nr:hypothetical protein AWZ03_014685 [Drosophila navojoa]
MAADSREYTAFTVPGRGLFQWRVMLFGLHSAGATFQRALDTVIGPEMEPHTFAYLDDMVVVGATKEQYVAKRICSDPVKKDQKWICGEEQEEALRELKERLTTAPILDCPDFSAKFVLQTEASDYGLGAVLTQEAEGVIAYH